MTFQKYIIRLRTNRVYAFNHIGNADETPIYFDMPRAATVNEKGSREVKVLSTGYEKLRVTVMLCVTADGGKLPPYIILKRTLVPKNEKFPTDVIVRAQSKGWMTTDLMEDWTKVVWEHVQEVSIHQKVCWFLMHLKDTRQTRLSRKFADATPTW